jgi:catechol 1,2-dioxygenase
VLSELLHAQGRSPFRLAHIHFRVSKPGFTTLIIQVFVDKTERVDNEVTFSVIPSLVGRFEMHDTLTGGPQASRRAGAR